MSFKQKDHQMYVFFPCLVQCSTCIGHWSSLSSPLISFRTTGPVLKKIKGHEIDRVTVQQTPFRAHVYDRKISDLFRN